MNKTLNACIDSLFGPKQTYEEYQTSVIRQVHAKIAQEQIEECNELMNCYAPGYCDHEEEVERLNPITEQQIRGF